MKLKLSEIIVPERRRAADPSKCRALMESIREVGLLNPITVLPDNTLVAGLHRKHACELLGWTEIPAVVVELDALKAELAEIDENLCRHERTALERAEDTARRKEIYEALHPETKAGVAGALVSNKTRHGHSATDPKSGSAASPSFVDDTASKTGRSRAAVAEDAKIGRDLAPDVRDALRGTDIANNQSALSALASQPEEAQRKLVAAGPKAVKEATKAKRARSKAKGRVSAEERKRIIEQIAADQANGVPAAASPDYSFTFEDSNDRLRLLVQRIDHALGVASGSQALGIVDAARDCATSSGRERDDAERRYQARLRALVDLSSRSERSNRR